MKIKLLMSMFLILNACSEPNPLVEMVKPENIKSTWAALGEAYLEPCDKQNKGFNASLCQQEIGQAVFMAFNNGHQTLLVSHFSDEMVARYLNNLHANSAVMSKKIATGKLKMDW